jgi:hypothetical protein
MSEPLLRIAAGRVVPEGRDFGGGLSAPAARRPALHAQAQAG